MEKKKSKSYEDNPKKFSPLCSSKKVKTKISLHQAFLVCEGNNTFMIDDNPTLWIDVVNQPHYFMVQGRVLIMAHYFTAKEKKASDNQSPPKKKMKKWTESWYQMEDVFTTTQQLPPTIHSASTMLHQLRDLGISLLSIFIQIAYQV